MFGNFKRFTFLTIFLSAAFLASTVEAKAITVYGVTTANDLVKFDSATPNTVTTIGAITNLQAGETIRGIDVRPRTGQLYALGSTSRIYIISKTTAAAVAVNSTPFTPALNGTQFGFDFNPQVDRIRIVSDADQNLRVNPDTGAVAFNDAAVQYQAGDINAGRNPSVTSSFYTDNFNGTASTFLYGVDNSPSIAVPVIPAPTLVIQLVAAGNIGQLVTVATISGLPAATTLDSVDFSSATNNEGSGQTMRKAFAIGSTGGTSSLYTLNFAIGGAFASTTLVGTIGSVPMNIVGIAADLESVPNQTIFALTSSGNLVRFNSSTPDTFTSIPLSGIPMGEMLVGVDFRLSNSLLYGLTDAGNIYTINTTTGAATFINALTVAPTAGSFGFDFNPVADRLRIVNTADQNLRHNIDAATTTNDGTLVYAVGDPNAAANPNVVAAAYTNNFVGAVSTTLYDIDSNLDILVTQTPPNNGTLNTVGALGFDIGDNAAFDIFGAGNVTLASFQLNGETASKLFRINLTTGEATFIATLGSTTNLAGGTDPIIGFAVQPGGVTAANAAVGGRVIAAKGKGISGAFVSVTNLATGEIHRALTNGFGYFELTDLPVGEAYTLTVSHKRWIFPDGSQTFQLNASRDDFEIVGEMPE